MGSLQKFRGGEGALADKIKSSTKMLSFVGRSSQLAPALKATSQAVASGVKAVVPGVAIVEENIKKDPETVPLTPASFAAKCATGPLIAKAGVGVTSQVRYAHTDLKVPDFGFYRRDATKDSRADSRESADGRASFSYLITASSVVTGAYVAKSVVSEFISSMSASADVLALAQIEVKMDDVPEGKSMTFKWRGKPLFIKHRTDAEIETEQAVNIAELRDQQHDSERCKDPQWLVVLGVCTHLGCVPIADAGDYGGYYCPCHGSHYDSSGRIRKGPAPLNLEVPIHSFTDDAILVG